MAVLPDERALGQRPTPQPSGAVAGYQPTTGMEGAWGQAFQQASGEWKQAAVALEQYQAIQDETNANDVYANKFSPAFRDMYQGYRQLQGKDAVDQMPAYVQKMQELRTQVRDSLPNPRQQKMFDEYSRRRVEMELDNMALHSNTQGKLWQIGTQRSNLQNDLNIVADAPDNPTSFADALELGRTHIYDYAKANGGIGIHGLTAAEEFKAFVSDALVTKYSGLIMSNPVKAEKELSDPEIFKSIDPKHRDVLLNRAKEGAVVAQTSSAANGWVDDALKNMKPEAVQPPQPSGGMQSVSAVSVAPQTDQLFKGVLAAERSGTHDISPKFAYGRAQVLESTGRAMAKKLGVPFDLNKFRDSDEYNMMLGKAYLDEQLQYFGGNPTLAYAAYNAGPAKVNEWIGRYGDPRTGAITDAEFTAHIPFKETREYVPRALAAAGAVTVAGGASPGDMSKRAAAMRVMPDTSGLPTSRDVRAQLPVLMAKIEPYVNEHYGTDTTNPERIRAVTALTMALSSRISKEGAQLDAIQKQAQGQLIDAIGGFSGGDPITDASQIARDPNLSRAWAMTDPVAKVSLAGMIASNTTKSKTDNNGLYWDVWKRIHLDPDNPEKIDFYQQVLQFAGPGLLNTAQIGQLRQEIDRQETPGGRSVGQMMRAAATRVESGFKSNIMFTMQPDLANAATMRWTEDASKKIDEYAKAGKNVRSLFMLDTPDSIVSPKYLQTYVNGNPAQGLAKEAGTVRQIGGTAPRLEPRPQVPAGIPAGSTLIGKTPHGKDVWMSPDNKRWVQ